MGFVFSNELHVVLPSLHLSKSTHSYHSPSVGGGALARFVCLKILCPLAAAPSCFLVLLRRLLLCDFSSLCIGSAWVSTHLLSRALAQALPSPPLPRTDSSGAASRGQASCRSLQVSAYSASGVYSLASSKLGSPLTLVHHHCSQPPARF